ncbi:hypothetical protein [Pseudobacteriovorax antillogorgiicola]|uniref:FTP domain-containing protein n=1 Tax=Pseudobacteriovorax antillogorgiicola TaxID=1513793 RepID=A0A1Y6BSC0_9BACT|nr:hypothetical protein [Pseudobacteriovorax antillogorgiicola]TCS53023.1 hypothetical protein EDD56_10874 [Pseudobacteriovorax antillogorgiicola]SMF26847.1 hypothetical protein SAMN06296036_108173 [Pseudobacteriovorax antillogorgiicola]
MFTLPRGLQALCVVCLAGSIACQETSESPPVYSSVSDSYAPISTDRSTGVTAESDTKASSESSNTSNAPTLTEEPAVFERRWIGGPDTPAAHLGSILDAFNREKFTSFQADEFHLSEERLLATSQYRRYAQVRAGIPVRGSSIRIWSHPETKAVVQIEARLSKYPSEPDPQTLSSFRGNQTELTRQRFAKATEQVAKHPLDPLAGDHESHFFWDGAKLVEEVKVHSDQGIHEFSFHGTESRVANYHYHQHQMTDHGGRVPARVYPIWELGPGLDSPSTLIPAEIDLLDPMLHEADKTDFRVISGLNLKRQNYSEDLGNTMYGRDQGLWNYDFLESIIRGIFATLPMKENAFQDEGSSQVRLVGKYARVFIHPAAANLYGINFNVDPAPFIYPSYQYNSETQESILNPQLRTFGRALKDRLDAYDRIPLPSGKVSNDIVELINSGFDEIQMYWAMNILFEHLHQMGFTDPELSTRPFDAILFNPSINARNNAYYSRDTINFTNYSPDKGNYARDNTVIWHEIGHGLQDRLMGDYYRFNDSGGLNEGMADIIAHLVVEARTLGQNFPGRKDRRINNRIGFHLTNESHDDGEAYGGAMMDMTDAAIKRFGIHDGLARSSELIFETMRLTRDHPGITAEVWFEHMIFADSLNRPFQLPSGAIREAGEMRSLIMDALKSRNFAFAQSDTPASFTVEFEDTVLSSRSLASRGNPIKLDLNDDETKSFTLRFTTANGSAFRFKYPLSIEIDYEGGPLQGSVDWLGQDREPQRVTISQAEASVEHTVTARGRCETINRSDNTCSDFVYLKLFQSGDSEPIGKKRFYVWSNKN